MIRSVRWRLVVVFGLVVALALGLVLVGVGFVVERSLIDATATRMELGAGLLGQTRPNRGRPSVDLSDPGLVQILGGEGTAVAILDETGGVLASASNGAGPEVDGARLAVGDYAAVIAGGETRREVVEATTDPVLMVVAPVAIAGTDPDDDGQGGGQGKGPPFVPPGQAKRLGTSDEPPNAVVQLSTSLAPVEAAVAELRIRLALIGLVALLIAMTVGAILTGTALRPLGRIADAADRLAGGDLGARTDVAVREDEIGRVAAAFDAMAERVEAIITAQRRFAADASHELRTPLTVLGGYVDLLQGEPAGDPGDRARVLEGMRREIDRLSRLAGDLLLLNQLESGGQLRPRRFDLAELTSGLGGAIRSLAGGRRVSLDVNGPLLVEADPDRLTQAMLNLVDNAARHGSATGEIRLAASPAAGMATIAVENDGPAIAPEDLPHIFDRFYRGGGTEGGSNGRDGHAGLGLAITKAIVTGSGGSIGATCDAGRTRFTITLPMVS